MEKHVTLRDLAKVTGVHFTTVGLALRNDPHVNQVTAERVRETARKLGYKHNAMLSALSSYRRGESRRFAGVLAYVLNYDPALYQGNLAEATLRSSVIAYAEAQGFSLESFHVTDPGMTGRQLSRAHAVEAVIAKRRTVWRC